MGWHTIAVVVVVVCCGCGCIGVVVVVIVVVGSHGRRGPEKVVGGAGRPEDAIIALEQKPEAYYL